MNTNRYEIEFFEESTKKLSLRTVSKASFAEAASWAYRHRNILGHTWKIDSIKRKWA